VITKGAITVTARAAPTTLPGWALMIALAAACYGLTGLLEPHIAIAGKSPLEPTILAILLGLLLRHVGWVPAACDTGVQRYEGALKVGIVLLGLNLTFLQVISLGAQAITVVLICLLAAPTFIYVIARRLSIAPKLAVLIGIGTTICGSTAIAIAAPVIEARDEDVSYAIGTIAVFGLLAMLTLPLAGAAIGMTNTEFGLWAGTAVHATPQVLGAAYMFSDGAGVLATVVKMTRNLFMIPAVFLLGAWYTRQRAAAAGKRLPVRQYWKAVPVFLFAFLALAMLRSLIDSCGVVPHELWRQTLGTVAWIAKLLVLVAMAGIGLNTRLEAMRRVGIAPLLVGLLGALFLAAGSYALIRGLSLGT